MAVSWSDKEAAVRALERGGKVDPADLVEAAKSPEHPCHEDFTWDVHTAAAERWRDQARAIIRRCKFEVVVDDVTERVVRYVESPGNERLHVSLPRMRSATTVSHVMASELAMLLGNASRVYGIALAKSDTLGADVVRTLGAIRDQIAELRSAVG